VSVGVAIHNLDFIDDRMPLHIIKIILTYFISLVIIYSLISMIKSMISKLNSWLYGKKKKLDPAKLTILWTIIVFLLGVIFKIKP